MDTETPKDDSIYLAAYGSAVVEDETLRAVGISQIGVETGAAATFRPSAAALEASEELPWKLWLEGTFCSRLGPELVRAYEATNAMKGDDLVQIDHAIDHLLTLDERTASLEAAEAYLEGKDQIRQAPQWERLVETISTGETPGHLPTLFAVQCAIFGLPLLSTLVAYAYFEWHLGMCHAGGLPQQHRFRHFEEKHPATFLSVRRVFTSQLNDEKTVPRLASV